MGFGKKAKRAVGSAIQAIPGAKQVIAPVAKIPGVTGMAGSSLALTERDQANAAAAADQLANQQAAAAEEQRLRALAEESVRAQDELARKRTIFGGEAIGTTQERKKLLGQ